MADLRLERLCSHHCLHGFCSGLPQADAAVRRLQERIVLDFDTGVGAVVAVAGRWDVAGLVAADDMYLADKMDAQGQSIRGWCVYYQQLAVAQPFQRSEALPLLLTAVDEIYERRVRTRDDYIGALATPLCAAPEHRRSLICYLQARGFKPLWSDPDLYFARHGQWMRNGKTWR